MATFVYAGHPTSTVSLTNGSSGVELAVTQFSAEGRTTARCVLDLAEFRELLADGAAIFTAIELTRHLDTPDHA